MFVLKRYVKRTVALLLLCVTVLGAFPVTVNALTTDQITANMNTLKASSYPDGWFWCGGDPYKSLSYSACGRKYSCYCNSYSGGYQCHGFAMIVAHRAVGSHPVGQLSSYKNGRVSNGWTCYTSAGLGKASLCAMGLRPGDIVRAATTADYADGHTAVVWKVENGKAYFAECWGSVYSKIKWGAFNYNYGYSLESICSGYSYVALWRNNSVQLGTGSCPHNYKTGCEAQHPHREYRTCIYCQETEYTGNYGSLDNCACCIGTHSYVVGYEEVHPHRETKTCNNCGAFVYTGNNGVHINCAICQGAPYDLEVSLDREGCSIDEDMSLSYSAVNAVSYDISVKKDGVRFAELNGITENQCSFSPAEVGTYIVTVTAYSEDKKSLSVTSEPFYAGAPISSVEYEDGRYFLFYDLSLPKQEAQRFCDERGLIMDLWTEYEIIASFADTDKLVNEYVGEECYRYIPGALPYGEASRFSQLLGGTLVSSANADIEKLLVRLCEKADSNGIILGSHEPENDGCWITEEGTLLNYFNWNLSHSGSNDPYKNYLFMFPGGTVIESYAQQDTDHGFVMKSIAPFSYIENEDGTLTLTKISARKSDLLEIPESHEGRMVTAIASDVFSNCSYGEVVIPNTVTDISPRAFADSNVESLAVYRGSVAHSMAVDYFSDIPLRIILPFEDVKNDAWYYEGVDYCYSRSYISGSSDTLFSPNLNLTREQFVLILANVAGIELSLYNDTDTGMTDVPKGRWYSPAIAWAVSEGYVNGVGEGIFGTGQNITREQLARLFFLYAEKTGLDVSARADLGVFEDEEQVSDWAYDNVAWAVASGLISGTSATTLDAKASATRAQAARIFMLFDRLRETE